MLNFKPENRRRKRVNQERRPVLLPHLPVPSTPPSSKGDSTPPPPNTPLSNSEGQQDRVNSDGASPSNAHPPVEENTEVQTKQPQPDDVSLTEYVKLRLDSVGPACFPSPTSTLSHRSLSDLSQPPSRLTGGQCQESNNRCPDPSSGGCALTLPFCKHNSTTISNYFASFVTQQIPGTRTQNAALSHRSSRVC